MGMQMERQLPKFLSIKAELIADIRSGRLKVQDQLPAREELLVRFGVAKETLNKALKELIRDGYLTARRNAGTFVCERKTKPKLGMIWTFDNRDNAALSNSLLFGMDELKLYLPYSGDYTLDFIEADRFRRAPGLSADYDMMLWMIPDEADFPLLADFRDKLIAINRYHESINYISTDHFRAQHEITLRWIHRFGAGNCALYYLDVKDNPFICRVRREGFIRACEEAGCFYRICRQTRDFRENVELLQREIPERTVLPTVVISPSRCVTGAVLNLAYRRRRRIGEDIWYSDFDSPNGTEVTGCEFPSVVQNHRLIAETALAACTASGGVPIRQFIPYEIINF
jgi:transcriptional regulator, gntR